MRPEHSAWIDEHVSGNCYGHCAEVTAAMAEAFPELTRVRGHYYCVAWGERAHWWLVDTDGTIVDPTAEQFPSHGNGHYEPWKEGAPEPTGKCANCGELVYTGDTVCSENCGIEYAAFCTGRF